MAFQVLARIEGSSGLAGCEITVSDGELPGGRRTILGGSVTRITRSFIEYRGGESGYETFTVPLDSVMRVALRGRTLFLRKKRVDRILPRR